jgi:hypothetical protein
VNRVLLWFWALWFSVVSASNAADALREAGLVPSVPFVSGNLGLVAESVAIYSVPHAAAVALFLLVLVLELAASFLFWRAALQKTPRIAAPFAAGIALFCGFLVFDELLLVYRRFPSLETTHFIVLATLLLSLLVVRARE